VASDVADAGDDLIGLEEIARRERRSRELRESEPVGPPLTGGGTGTGASESDDLLGGPTAGADATSGVDVVERTGETNTEFTKPSGPVGDTFVEATPVEEPLGDLTKPSGGTSSGGPTGSGPTGGGPSSGPPTSDPPTSGPPTLGPPDGKPPTTGPPPTEGPPTTGPPTSGPPTSGPPTGPPPGGPPNRPLVPRGEEDEEDPLALASLTPVTKKFESSVAKPESILAGENFDEAGLGFQAEPERFGEATVGEMRFEVRAGDVDEAVVALDDLGELQ